MVKIIKVTAGVIVDKGKVLITRRAPEDRLAGGWEFPGGKIEANETPEECLVRELKEELNINVSVDQFCTEVSHSDGDRQINLMAFYCTILDGEIQISVHDKFKWIPVNDLLKYDLLPADVLIAKKVIEEFNA
ncbi:MAG TPA: (deoxy)nucleoside triphosphate pyrophosphohydrolase [Defluviitaleaceae bacterium]|jgi:8-oxo-dGTP diphosphatase|nr:(deoxy)nucleoside triphosphate pyrophosphohydrolase [Defluviitaleaceae bacterium]HQD49912.1 (deoxy)nucleoside triphosphate pyrophosphohydrolase [Defluviitaleaceae bacterium]